MQVTHGVFFCLLVSTALPLLHAGDVSNIPPVGIIGAGRLGSHLAATWSQQGVDVLLSSSSNSAHKIVAALSKGHGYTDTTKGIDIEPFHVTPNAALVAGSVEEAASRHVVVLCTPFPATANIIASMKQRLQDRAVIVIDMTNPFYSGPGLPSNGKQSAAQIHQDVLGDVTASWAVAYKHTNHRFIYPSSTEARLVHVAGDQRAKAVAIALVKSHGFRVLDHGGLEQAVKLEPGRRRNFQEGEDGDL
jgi:predicted dinucleotide-binding enzyme